MIPKWIIVLIVISVPYHAIARYCDFKQAIGLKTNNCSCKLK